jgi:hypothetical protein
MKCHQLAADAYESKRKLTNSDDCMRDAFIAGAEWAANSGYDRNKLVVFGTDDCKECETGRITLFSEEHRLCIECYHKHGNKP